MMGDVNEETTAQEVLGMIIRKGGFIGNCAELFRNDESQTLQFLADCADQCLYTNISDFWGEDLTSAILKYRDPSRNNANTYGN